MLVKPICEVLEELDCYKQFEIGAFLDQVAPYEVVADLGDVLDQVPLRVGRVFLRLDLALHDKVAPFVQTLPHSSEEDHENREEAVAQLSGGQIGING